MSHWQYLAHVEPVLPTPRVGDTISWRPELPDLPLRRFGLPIACLVAACALAEYVAAPATGWGPLLALANNRLVGR